VVLVVVVEMGHMLVVVGVGTWVEGEALHLITCLVMVVRRGIMGATPHLLLTRGVSVPFISKRLEHFNKM